MGLFYFHKIYSGQNLLFATKNVIFADIAQNYNNKISLT